MRVLLNYSELVVLFFPQRLLYPSVGEYHYTRDIKLLGTASSSWIRRQETVNGKNNLQRKTTIFIIVVFLLLISVD